MSDSTIHVFPTTDRAIAVPVAFSLAETCGPVMWGKGRWPGSDWIEQSFVWVGWESDSVSVRWVRQELPGELMVGGLRSRDQDERWLSDVLGVNRVVPRIDDPVIAEIAARFPGVRPYCGASLFDSIVGCIAGQSITVQAAAVTEARICALVHPGVETAGRRFWPSPLPAQLAALEPATVRTTGVTWKRAEAIVAAARAQLAGVLPADDEARADPDAARVALRKLPLVGAWTAESVLLWGLGLDDAFPPNDAALLRAARLAYGAPELDHRGLEKLAENWRPGRAWASRWLWIAMFGTPMALGS